MAQNVSVANQFTEAITLTLNATDGGHMMTVGSDSTQQQSVPSLISITINGQTLTVGQNGSVTLPDNSTVNVVWSNDPVTGLTIMLEGSQG